MQYESLTPMFDTAVADLRRSKPIIFVYYWTVIPTHLAYVKAHELNCVMKPLDGSLAALEGSPILEKHDG